MMKSGARLLHVTVWLVIVGGLAGCNLSQSPSELTVSAPTETGAGTVRCDEQVERALASVPVVCNSIGRNQACYGNRSVEVEFEVNPETPFDAPGSRVDLLRLRRLTASPFDEALETWGIAIIKAQANLPDTLPGQNVTLLLVGNTTLNGLAPAMTALVLKTGIHSTDCASVPPSMAIVQSPEGTQVTMNFNGASLTLGSTVTLTATQSNLLTVATIEGTVVVSAFDVTRIVMPGAQVVLPLGGDAGLQVIGPPSAVQPLDLSSVQSLPLTLLDRPVSIPPPISQPVTVTPPLSVLATSTISVPFDPQVPTAQPETCMPRADWTASYTIQVGDTLFAIASRYNVTLAQLQQANCITDPDRIFSGQVLRVPFQIVTATPLPTVAPTTAQPNQRAVDTSTPTPIGQRAVATATPTDARAPTAP